MNRFITHSEWSIVVLICLCLGGCGFLNPVSPQTPSTLPPELSIEEHALQSAPELEPLTFVPVEGTQEEVLSKHQDKRATVPSPHGGTGASLEDDNLTATTNVTNTDEGQEVSVEVSRDGEMIYSMQLGDTCAIPPLWGLWAYDDHWVLEVAYVKANRQGNAIYCESFGQIIQDGVSLNEQHGYQESFGFQLMNGKPFYFFKKRGRLGISYDSQEIPLGYTRVPHHQCCSGAALNPKSSANMVAFFAQRGKTQFYVEIGIFE